MHIPDMPAPAAGETLQGYGLKVLAYVLAHGTAALTDEQLRTAAPVSLYADAPLTSQFVLEDHAVRHSYHHLARIERAVQR